MSAVAVFRQENIVGEAVATSVAGGTRLSVRMDKLPPGAHGFHIHTAGDLRGAGCSGACSHWHKGSRHTRHGDRPTRRKTRSRTIRSHGRHTGDLGNIEQKYGRPARYTYFLSGVRPSELWGRTLIIHADPDDLGRGDHEDSGTTGHSGARIGCAIFGRGSCES